MKITGFNDTTVASAGGGGAAGPAGGDLGGGYPAPQVVGLDGKPFAAPGTEANGDIIQYDAATGKWIFVPASSGGLSSVTDGTTTVSPADSLTVPPHSLTNGGAGNAILDYMTGGYGAQEELHTVAASGAAQTLPATANVHDITLTANCTLTLPTVTSGKGCSISVILRQDGTGSRTVTWPGSVSWVNGTAPVLKTAASAVDVITLFTVDGGTTWGGAYVGAAGSTTIWRPLMATDDGGAHYYVVTAGDGTAVMVAT